MLFSCFAFSFNAKTADMGDTVVPVVITTGILQIDVVSGTGFKISMNGGALRPQGLSYYNSKADIGVSVTVVANSITGKEFVGGSTHGNEVLTDITFFLDDVRYNNPQSLHNQTGNKLRIIRRSNLYRSDDNTVNIASHYVDYLFENNKITIDNRINWNVNTNLGISFMTMLGLKRTNDHGQVSSYGIKEGDGRLLNISQTDHTETQNTYKCRKAYAFNDSIVGAKTYTSVQLLEDDYLPHSSFHFDNRENYNKFYFDHCGVNYNVIAGDIWHTKSQYHIEYLGSVD